MRMRRTFERRGAICLIRSLSPHSQPRALRHITISHTSQETPQSRASRRLNASRFTTPEVCLDVLGCAETLSLPRPATCALLGWRP